MQAAECLDPADAGFGQVQLGLRPLAEQARADLEAFFFFVSVLLAQAHLLGQSRDFLFGPLCAKSLVAQVVEKGGAHGFDFELWLFEQGIRASGTVRAGAAETDIFITPGYRFKVVDRLITNFHLPKSTLLMLVSAFAGFETMRRAYAYAITSGYRFYSYGDASLLWRGE